MSWVGGSIVLAGLSPDNVAIRENVYLSVFLIALCYIAKLVLDKVILGKLFEIVVIDMPVEYSFSSFLSKTKVLVKDIRVSISRKSAPCSASKSKAN